MMYTIVGFWPDSGQRFTESIEHDDSYLAEQAILAENLGLTLVATFEGDLTPVDEQLLIQES